jgi:hypothetical protein
VTDRLRCWNERVHGVCAAHPARAAPPESDPPSTPLLTVAMPATGLRMTPEALVDIILAQTENNDVDLIAEPPAELVAAWKRGEYEDEVRAKTCDGWRSWGPLCLVCHGDVPEGDATAYPFIFGSRACLGDCAAYLDSLLRVHDRSRRGRWRPAREIHTLANGALCGACPTVAR